MRRWCRRVDMPSSMTRESMSSAGYIGSRSPKVRNRTWSWVCELACLVTTTLALFGSFGGLVAKRAPRGIAAKARSTSGKIR